MTILESSILEKMFIFMGGLSVIDEFTKVLYRSHPEALTVERHDLINLMCL